MRSYPLCSTVPVYGVAVAGVLSIAQPFVDQLAVEMNKVAEHETIYDEHVENAIDQARYRIFARRVDWAMKTTFGFRCLSDSAARFEAEN